MPLPSQISQQATNPTDPEKNNCRVFVSYSHNDSDEAKQFMAYFRLQLEGLPELAISPEQVFFDRNKLRAGEEWDESIQCALEQAEYFIFLVSVNSLNSNYCCSRELAAAVQKSLRIIQVILAPCPWENKPIPQDSRKRNLGALGALPKDDRFSLKPVSDWVGKDRAHVWNEVVKQITEAMSQPIAQPAQQSIVNTTLAAKTSQHKLRPLLPYFCNQTVAVNDFNKQIKLWNNTALLVLAKGVYDDDLPNFWKRLHHKNLNDYLAARNAELQEPRPFIWPLSEGRKINTQEIKSDMISALSDALTQNPFLLTDETALSHYFSESPKTFTLVTNLPKEPKIHLTASIRTLLDLLEQCPAETPLNRLVIAMMVEDNELVNEKDLYKTLKMSTYQRTHLLEIEPLKPIGKDDISRWHRDYQVEELSRINEDNLLRNHFANLLIQPLRMRKFAEKINEIL